MAAEAVCPPRRALVEIPAPQPKIAAKMRRSYLEILSNVSPLAPSPGIPRARSSSSRTHSLDSSPGSQWRGRSESCEPMDEQRQRTSLSNQQLAQLIRSLIMVEQSQEPRPLTYDLKHLQEDLQLKKASVLRSIPYSRFGSNRDARCYRKAYPHLLAFKASCQRWGEALLGAGRWDAALEYGLMAWRYAGELPRWDTAEHNAVTQQCFRTLAALCLAALRRRGDDHDDSAAKGRSLLRRLKMAQQHSQAIAPCVREMERILEHSRDSAMDTQ